MKVLRWISRRVVHSVAVFFVVVTVTFFVFRLVPGDPTGRFVSDAMSPQDILRIRQMFGLDQPVWIQYLKYLRNIATLDFGLSLVFLGIPVTTLVGEKLLNSLGLMLSAVLFCIGTAGVFLRRNIITILLSIEVMLNAVNLTFVAVDRFRGLIDGQIIVFFVMTVAAAEAAVGLAIVIALFRHKEMLTPDAFTSLKW